jgi:hypothetical protein
MGPAFARDNGSKSGCIDTQRDLQRLAPANGGKIRSSNGRLHWSPLFPDSCHEQVSASPMELDEAKAVNLLNYRASAVVSGDSMPTRP